jgi:hypothetical protein
MTTTPASTGEMDHLDQLGAKAAGLETCGGDTLRATSNRPWALSQITRSPAPPRPISRT